MKLIPLGFGNLVAAERVVAILTPESAPTKRLMLDAKENGRVIDASCGRKTRAVVVTDSEHVIFSAMTPEVLRERLEGKETADMEADV